MEKRIQQTSYDVKTPYWLNDVLSDNLSVEDHAKRDARDVSEKHRSEIAKKVKALTQTSSA